MGSPLRVFIAEDESKVCKLLLKLIDWDGLGLELAGTSLDGLEALGAIGRLKPDIVITDILMPGIDGLELVRRCKSAGAESRFVIVSGHRDFDYAREALKSGVEDYILKPVQKEELNRTLEKIRRKARDSGPDLVLRGQLAESREILRRQFAFRLVESRGSLDRSAFERYVSEYQLRFSGRFFQSLFILPIPRTPDFDAVSSSPVLEKIADLPAGILIPCRADAFSVQDREGVSLFINYGEDAADKLQFCLRELGERTANLAETLGGCRVVIGAGSVGLEPFDWARSLEEAVMASRCRASFPKCAFISWPAIESAAPPPDPTLDAAQERSLTAMFEVLDVSAFTSWLNSFYSTLPADYPPWFDFAAAERILELFDRIIGPARKEGGASSVSAEVYHHFRNAVSRTDIVKALAAPIESAMLAQAAARRSRESLPVRIARDYIDSHYSEQLRLEDLAEKAQLNPTYLGSLFKKETGILFSDYLINRRIEAAKDLLRTTNKKLSAVSSEVGYPEVKYFFKVFRKIVGVTPAEYRGIYR